MMLCSQINIYVLEHDLSSLTQSPGFKLAISLANFNDWIVYCIYKLVLITKSTNDCSLPPGHAIVPKCFIWIKLLLTNSNITKLGSTLNNANETKTFHFKPVWIRATDFCRSDNDFHMSHEAISCSNLSQRFVEKCFSDLTSKDAC